MLYEETEAAPAAFYNGRAEVRQRLNSLKARLESMAPVNQTLRINHMPKTGARILRKLADIGLLNGAIRVAGTNTIFAYEATASVFFPSEIMATADIDLLMDARVRLKLTTTNRLNEKGFLGILHEVDGTFAISNRKYRAINDEGYMVDLIVAQERDPILTRCLPDRVSQVGGDFVAAEIEGLS